jgi:hypothetical protein
MRPTERTIGVLLRLYPSAWRARYAVELEGLVRETSGGRMPWRTAVDLAASGVNERFRTVGLSADSPAPSRARAGSLVVLCAWVLFVFAGAVVQKFSEHWQNLTPARDRSIPTHAFDALVGGAAIGSVVVLAGIALSLPAVLAFLRAGGWRAVRTKLLVAMSFAVLLIALAIPLAVHAHGLTARQRNGHDLGYELAALAVAVLAAATLVAWTVAAVSVARRLELPRGVLRLEAVAAGLVTMAMAAMTGATVIWWVALAHSAPWFLGGSAPLQLVLPGLMMATATLVAAAGATRALSALPALG